MAVKFEPELWNSRARKNNCYNYAINCLSDDYKQPGMKSGRQREDQIDGYAYSPELMAKAVIEDGYILREASKDEEVPDGFHLVCLMIAKFDYHWLRQDSDGTWSHKVGTDWVDGGIDDPVEYCYEHTQYGLFGGYFLASSELKDYKDTWSNSWADDDDNW